MIDSNITKMDFPFNALDAGVIPHHSGHVYDPLEVCEQPGGSCAWQLVPLGMPLARSPLLSLLLACLTGDAGAVVQQVALADRGH